MLNFPDATINSSMSLTEFDQQATPSFKHQELRRAGIFIMFLSIFLVSTWFFFVSNIDALHEDNYYLLLMPIIVPTILAFGWINWLGMQFFKRN